MCLHGSFFNGSFFVTHIGTGLIMYIAATLQRHTIMKALEEQCLQVVTMEDSKDVRIMQYTVTVYVKCSDNEVCRKLLQ